MVFLYVAGLVEQFQPVLGFKCLFLGDFQLGDKVFFTLRVLCFVEIGADGGAAAQKLVGQYGFFVNGFDIAAEDHDLFRKVFGTLTQGAVGHGYHLGDSIAE